MIPQQLGSRGLAFLLAVIVLTGQVLAHGGTYTGPGAGNGTGGSGSGGTGGKVGGGQARGRAPVPSGVDSAKWESWWAANREDFLIPRPPGSVAADNGYGTDAPRPLNADEIRKQVIPILLSAFKDRDHEIRNSAAIALGKVGDGHETEALIAGLADRERSVVEGAIIGLGLLGDGKAAAALSGVFADSGRSTRERGLAALALGLSGCEEARKPLFDGLGQSLDSSGGMRVKESQIESARILGAALWSGADRKDGNTDRAALVAPLLQRAISNPTIKDRSFLGIGCASLSKPRDPGSLPFILTMLNDKRADVRAGAAIAAGRIVRADDRKSVQALITAIGSEADLFPKRLLLISLGRVGGPDARKQLVLEFEAADRQHRAFAALALGICGAVEVAPRLRKELESASDESLRGALAIGLGLMHDADAFKLVADITKKEGSPDLLAHLMWYYALVRPRAAIPIVEHVLTAARTADLQAAAALTLGLLGSIESEPMLLKLLTESGTITVKAAAATGLGRMGDRKALDALAKVIKDTKEQDISRAFAVVGLGVLAQKFAFHPLSRVAIDGNYDVRNEPIDEVKDLL